MSILPFSLQLPSGYSLSSGSSGTQATGASSSATTASATSADPVDVISISNSSFVAGDFTAKAGDIYRMSDLFQTTAPTGQTTAGFRVALGDVATGDGGGKLQLNGADIDPARTSFSADEFAQLTYVAGTHGPQNLVVIAQTGTRLTNADGSPGALTHEIDSPAVQITADVTGSRSINAMNALSTTPTGADAEIASIVQQAGIFTGFVGTTRSALQTDGNFTAKAGDIYRMGDLFQATAPTGQTIAGFRVALGDVATGDGGGKLQSERRGYRSRPHQFQRRGVRATDLRRGDRRHRRAWW